MTTKYGLQLKNILDDRYDQFKEMVSINAYYRAEKRGFEPGHEIKDWYEAELEIGRQFRRIIAEAVSVMDLGEPKPQYTGGIPPVGSKNMSPNHI